MLAATATRRSSNNNNMASVNNNKSDNNSNNTRSHNCVHHSRSGSSGGVEDQQQQEIQQQQLHDFEATKKSGLGEVGGITPPRNTANTTTTTTAAAAAAAAAAATTTSASKNRTGTGGGGSAGFGTPSSIPTPPRGSDWKSPIMTHFGGGGGERKNKRSSSSTTTTTTIIKTTNEATQIQATEASSDTAMNHDDSIEAVLVEETTTTSPDSKKSSGVTVDCSDLPQPPEKEETAALSTASIKSAFPFSSSLSEEESSDRSSTTTPSIPASSLKKAPTVTASALSAEHPTGVCDTLSPQRRRERSDSLKIHELEEPIIIAPPPALTSSSSLELSNTDGGGAAAQQIATHFAFEHKIFLQAALALLTERDRHAPTVGMMDPVVLKSGPLKKASHLMNGVWKVKYVEIRRGMFSYYENVAKDKGTPGQLRRKNIPLDAGHFGYGGTGSGTGGAGAGTNGGAGGAGNSGSGGGGGLTSGNSDHNRVSAGGTGNSSNDHNHAPCTCRAVRLHQKAFLKLTTPGQAGAMFELSVHGRKRLWMANSRAERAVWMQAIENAMVGGSVTGYNSTSSAGGDVFDHRGKIRHVSPRSPFRSDLRLYLRLQSYLRSIHTKTEYVDGLREVLNHPIKVPVKWIAKQALLSDQAEGNNAFLEQEVNLSVEQLWRDLQRDSVCIDGKVYRGDHPTQGPERILGALMRRILQTAAASSTTRTDWTQAQALSFARDILLSGNRTRSGGDSYFCINSLLKHPELVVVVPSGTEVEPVAITVSQDESDLPLNAKSGWIQTRSSKLQRSWKKFFFVLSEGMLTHYERAAPRPHGLRGQLAMTDVSISVARRQRPNSSSSTDTYFVISIVAKDGKERLLRFENEDRILDWTHALETMARAKAGASNSKNVTNGMTSATEPIVSAPSSTSTTASAARRLMPRRRNSQDEANSNQNNNNNNSTSAASTTLASTTSGTTTSNLAEQLMEVHGRNLGISMDKVKERLALRSRKTSSAVRVVIQAVTDYKICTTDPDGDEQLDTWGYVRTQFQQSFRLSGGPSGFISRGEEIVIVTVIDCVDLGGHGGEETQQRLQQHSANPSSPDEIPPSPARRQLRKTRIFRQFIDDPGAEDP